MARSLNMDDVVELYDKATRQLTEDRKSVEDVFDELREHVRDHPTRYVELGEVLAKMTDLKMKQTAQMIDLLKTVEKARPKDEEGYGSLSDNDRMLIEKAIRDEDEKK